MNKAIIIGGTRGVGYEILKMFNDKKIPVLFTGTKLHQVKTIEKQFDDNLIKGLEINLNCMMSIEKFKLEIKSLQYEPNILIYNAGYLSLRSNEKDVNIQKLFQINTISPIILTQFFLPFMQKNNNGHIIFNSPPYKIDEKVKFLTPYMQSKLAQTTYMKSLSKILEKTNISCNSIWTNYPLWTDAIKLRNVGKEINCVHPSILSKVVEEIIFNENANTFKGHEIIDEFYLKSKNIDPKLYYLGNDIKYLDELFLNHLKSLKK